jgi:23S rRNA pseudouridine1911/1915/1917 synthase
MPETPARMQSPPERRRPEAEEIEVTVLYEDDWLIAIDKPPGMVVHPTYKNWSGTLLNALLWRVRGREALIPSIITRLDKQTSGLVLVALSPAIHAKVQRDAEVGLVRKEYLALVEGVPFPDAGTIALPLARSAEDRRRVVVVDSGQPSETRYQVLGYLIPLGYSTVAYGIAWCVAKSRYGKICVAHEASFPIPFPPSPVRSG